MSFAQMWRTKTREAPQIERIKTDSHAPNQLRASGTARNQPSFYEAFHVEPGERMYLPPEDRVIMW